VQQVVAQLEIQTTPFGQQPIDQMKVAGRSSFLHSTNYSKGLEL